MAAIRKGARYESAHGLRCHLSLLCARHKNRGKLNDLVAEHLDHLHYLNDILIINCEFLNDVLTDHLLNRLFLPLYVYSLVLSETVRDLHV